MIKKFDAWIQRPSNLALFIILVVGLGLAVAFSMSLTFPASLGDA